MVKFPIFPRYYKNKNKNKNHWNNKKGTHLSKVIIINLPRMKKSNQNIGWVISNGLLNFAHIFCHTCKTHGYGLLSCNVLVLCVWNFGILDESCLRNERSIEWMECDSNLLCYGLFWNPKNYNYFKCPFKHLKKLLKTLWYFLYVL
jgi:hypothetical protein